MLFFFVANLAPRDFSAACAALCSAPGAGVFLAMSAQSLLLGAGVFFLADLAAGAFLADFLAELTGVLAGVLLAMAGEAFEDFLGDFAGLFLAMAGEAFGDFLGDFAGLFFLLPGEAGDLGELLCPEESLMRGVSFLLRIRTPLGLACPLGVVSWKHSPGKEKRGGEHHQ